MEMQFDCGLKKYVYRLHVYGRVVVLYNPAKVLSRDMSMRCFCCYLQNYRSIILLLETMFDLFSKCVLSFFYNIQ